MEIFIIVAYIVDNVHKNFHFLIILTICLFLINQIRLINIGHKYILKTKMTREFFF